MLGVSFFNLKIKAKYAIDMSIFIYNPAKNYCIIK